MPSRQFFSTANQPAMFSVKRLSQAVTVALSLSSLGYSLPTAAIEMGKAQDSEQKNKVFSAQELTKISARLKSLKPTSFSVSQGSVNIVEGIPLSLAAPLAKSTTLSGIHLASTSTVVLPATEPTPVMVVAQNVPAAPQINTSGAVVSSIKFIGNQSIASQYLEPMINGYIGKAADANTIKELTEKIRQYYSDQGFMVTQVINVSPNLNALDLRIFEGYVGQIKVNNTASYSAEDIKGYALKAICRQSESCEGYPLVIDHAERMVGIISDLPGITPAQMVLSPGQSVGTTDITIRVEPSDTFTGYAAYDNYGSKNIGKDRLTLGFVGNNLAGIGDQLVAEGTFSTEKNNTIGQINYSLPVGHDGWRIGTGYTRTDSEILESNTKIYEGQNNTFSLYASYPLIRTSAHNLLLRASYDYSLPEIVLGDTAQPRSKNQGLSLSLSGRFNDRAILGRSFSTYGLTVIQSKVEKRDDTFSDPTGNSNRYTYYFSRDQELMQLGDSGRLSAFINVRGQETSKKLGLESTYSLGGPNGVRAYNSGSAPGDRGVIATAELRYGTLLQPLLPGFVSVALFHDYGWTEYKTESRSSHLRNLRANGVSLALSILDRWSVTASYAERAGSKKPSLTEITSDNGKSNRWWLTASVSF